MGMVRKKKDKLESKVHGAMKKWLQNCIDYVNRLEGKRKKQAATNKSDSESDEEVLPDVDPNAETQSEVFWCLQCVIACTAAYEQWSPDVMMCS